MVPLCNQFFLNFVKIWQKFGQLLKNFSIKKQVLQRLNHQLKILCYMFVEQWRKIGNKIYNMQISAIAFLSKIKKN